MAGTIQQIAELAGVSRGTVDRALNNRGRVNSDVAEKIRQIAADLGYTSKHGRKAIEKRERSTIGVITQLAGSPFMTEVNRGIRDAAAQLHENGIEVIIKDGRSVDVDEQLHAIRELRARKISGLAIMPVERDEIRLALNNLSDQLEIPIVTFNSDIVGTKRCCYVGMDNEKSGRTAAGLMNILTGGKGKILVITGFFSNNVDNARVNGFVDELKQSFPGLEIIGVQGSFDETEEVRRIVVNSMKNYTALDGIYLVSSGQRGLPQAFQELGLQKRPKVIIYDLTEENKEILLADMADFLIDQEGYEQGYRSLMVLGDLLLKGKSPEQDALFTDIQIKTKYNI